MSYAGVQRPSLRACGRGRRLRPHAARIPPVFLVLVFASAYADAGRSAPRPPASLLEETRRRGANTHYFLLLWEFLKASHEMAIVKGRAAVGAPNPDPIPQVACG
jgi:hypothetical protein